MDLQRTKQKRSKAKNGFKSMLSQCFHLSINECTIVCILVINKVTIPFLLNEINILFLMGIEASENDILPRLLTSIYLITFIK